MTPRKLAPEADLAHVLDLALVALRAGTMLDPEDLLCDLYQVDERELVELLDGITPGQRPLPARTLTTEPGTPERINELSRWADADNAEAEPDQSGPASRARAEYLATGRQWRQAEAGTELHLLEGSRPLCGSHDAGPWRSVAGVAKCRECVDLDEVLARHG